MDYRKEEKRTLTPLQPGTYEEIIFHALAEDVFWGDITTDNLELPKDPVKAELITREPCVLAGWQVFMRTFFLIDENITQEYFQPFYEDGDEIPTNEVIATMSLPPATLLKGERVALNFLTHLSGIATLTRRFVNLIGTEGPAIADTRKTLPGLRALQKYAVRAGGGINHRLSLSHSVMIKNNHIALTGSITEAVKQIKNKIGHTVKIEVEASNLDDVNEALSVGVDIIMLDNFSIAEALEAVKLIDGRAIVELSGGINESNIVEYALVGADIISMGALTHSAKAIDMALHTSG